MSDVLNTRSLDPYRRCEEHCLHDLARGVLISDLLGPNDGDDHVHEHYERAASRVAEPRVMRRIPTDPHGS